MKRETVEKDFNFFKKAFDKFYVYLVLACVSVFLLALYIAIGMNTKIGIAIGVAVMVLYAVLTSTVMKHILGVGYIPHGSEISVSVKNGGISAKDGRKYIPRRMLWLDVTAISGGAKTPDGKTEELYIFKGITRIEADAFEGMTSLKKISFEGTALEWSEIDCKADLDGIETVFLGEATSSEQ